LILDHEKRISLYQGFGSGFGLNPDSIRSVDPDPYSESGSRRAKITHKNKFLNFYIFLIDGHKNPGSGSAFSLKYQNEYGSETLVCTNI
jgi:hypothetical protein